MLVRKGLLTIVTAALVMSAGVATVAARAPNGVTPGPSCKMTYIGSQTQKATKLDKAKQRARGNWEYQAWKRFGGKYNDWAKAQYKQYGCSKKGNYHYCIAEAFPCSQVEEVQP